MIEGGGSSDFRRVRAMLYARPDLLHSILAKNAEALVRYLSAQIRAGAQAVMLFDTWGGILSAADYREFSLQYMARILAALPREQDGDPVPTIVYTKGGGEWLEDIAAIGCSGVGLDWTVDLPRARKRIGERVALQGNLDPHVLFAPPEVVRRETTRILEQMHGFAGHVFNLGHGILPATPPENVAALVETVRAFQVPA
jgi:uroporphyrinogen decarboxylase